MATGITSNLYSRYGGISSYWGEEGRTIQTKPDVPELCDYCGSRNRNVDHCTQCGAPMPIVPVRIAPELKLPEKGITVNVTIGGKALDALVKSQDKLSKAVQEHLSTPTVTSWPHV